MPNPEKPNDLIWSPGKDPLEARHLCLACWKRKQGANFIELDEQLKKAMRLEQPERWQADIKPKFPADIEEIWPDQEGRLIGIVMADGDGIGQLIDKIQTPILYSTFSQALAEIGLQAVARAILETDLDHKNTGWIDLLPIIYGGDDFTFFLPAEKALAFALALGNAFADLTGRAEKNRETEAVRSIQAVLAHCRPGQTHLTLSLGVAVAKPSFPFYTLRSLATELRQNAKRQRVGCKSVEGGEGWVDFAMITSASAEELSDMRKHYDREEGGSHYSLTSWPYALSGMKELLNLRSEVIKEIPRSQRKFLYTEFWHSRSAVETAYRSLVKKNSLPITRRALSKLGCEKSDSTPFSGVQRERTVLLDALEIAELADED